MTPAAAAWYERAALDLTDEVVGLQALLASREVDVQVYREIATAAIHDLHRLTTARYRDRARYLALLDELRALRGAERQAAA